MPRDLLEILTADETITAEMDTLQERFSQLKNQREALAREATEEIKRLNLSPDRAFGSDEYWAVVIVRGVAILVNVYDRPSRETPPLERLNLQTFPTDPDAFPS
ncbi:MAG: hypothetical protein MH825_13100 [Cyanobacteria bacterium]|nr:hypothetical protein [Cyanobacteriota bacterium]